MKKLALLLLIAVAAVFAQYPPERQFNGQMLITYGGIAVLLMFISLFTVGIVYMVGTALSLEKFKSWAKGELIEVFYSAFIFGMILSAYTAGTSVSENFAQAIDPFGYSVVCANPSAAFPVEFTGGGLPLDPEKDTNGYYLLPCHLRIAKNFLASIFYETAGFVKAVGITHSWYTFLSSFQFDFTPVGTTTFFSGAGFSHSIFGFLNAKNNALQFLFDNGVKVLTVVRFQEVFINFVGIAVFPSLLMLGLILRSFSVTRKAGGLFMALALALFFIFPVFYIVGDSVYNSVRLSQNANPADPPSVLANVFNPDMSGAPQKIYNDPAYQESKDVVTNGDLASNKLLSQIGVLTAIQNCQQTQDYVQGQGGNVAGNPDTGGILSFFGFGDGNPLLGTWFSGTYSKGGSWNPLSFNSILVGIDVLAKALFFAAFFSFLSIITTIAAVRSFSTMLGGDVEIAGLTHLI